MQSKHQMGWQLPSLLNLRKPKGKITRRKRKWFLSHQRHVQQGCKLFPFSTFLPGKRRGSPHYSYLLLKGIYQ
jgi:hypothetical protein